ncbi:unnamed protein product [Lampetra planeri]
MRPRENPHRFSTLFASGETGRVWRDGPRLARRAEPSLFACASEPRPEHSEHAPPFHCGAQRTPPHAVRVLGVI